MDSVELSPLSCLICPAQRTKHNKDFSRKKIGENIFLVIDSSYYFSNVDDDNNFHHLYPLFWCNNKESEDKFHCGACRCRTIGTSYYFCNECNIGYHKECIESPPVIKSLYHPKHPLQLLTFVDFGDDYYSDGNLGCYYCESKCGTNLSRFFYYCFVCSISLDLVCARKSPFLNYKKRHQHTLDYFPRNNTNLICDVCGLVDNKPPIYVCLECDFLVHKSCIYLPFLISISRHEHRLFFTHSPHLCKNFSCGVCRQNVDENYGRYSCTKGCTYVVHSKCATRNDVWNGRELEEEPEEIYENLNSFELIGDGIIQHFGHSHHMRFEKETTDMLYDEKKKCQACVLPIYGGGVYKCMNLECDFLLHEACANLPRMKQHMAYPYPVILEASDTTSYFFCEFCSVIRVVSDMC